MKRNTMLLIICSIAMVTLFGSVYNAITAKDFEELKTAVQAGEDINEINPFDDEQRTPLLRALSYGWDSVYIEMANYLIEQGAELDYQDKKGFTALHYAAKGGHLETVRMLLERGANIALFPDETQSYKGETALSAACDSTGNDDKNLEVVKLLLEKGASTKKNPLAFQSPLTDAIYSKGIKTAQCLLEYGADPNVPNNNQQYPLYLAIDKGLDNGFIKVLLEKGADANKGSGYYTPLEMAIKKRNIDLMQMLIDAGADIRYIDENGNTLFHAAAKINSSKNISFLLEKGLDINARNDKGETPLHISAEKGYKSVIVLMIENGADIFAKNVEGHMPMHIHLFTYESDPEHVQWLLSKGVDVNMNAIEDSFAPLHLAAGNGNAQMVEFLLSKGADATIRGMKSYTPLHAAAANRGTVEVVQLLLEQGVDINAENDDGYTPLFEALLSLSNEDVIQYLFANGADINHTDKQGKTMVHHAAEEKWDGEELIALLHSMGADMNIRDNAGNTPGFYAATDEIKELLNSLK